MARVRNLSIEEVPADCQPIYKRFSEEYGPFLNQVKVFAHRPPALKHGRSTDALATSPLRAPGLKAAKTKNENNQ